jgi:hypothetical protein
LDLADKRFYKYLNDNGTERLRFRIITQKGKVSDVVIQYETLINGKWVAIVRYDCAHGFFHKDMLLPDGSQEKTAIAINDLNIAIDYAEQELKDNWEIYKQKYLKGIIND